VHSAAMLNACYLRPSCCSAAFAVALMSLRAQLQAPPGNDRPIIAATLNADQMHDSSRCNAVLWAPRSNGSQFLACHVSGSILVYKKVGCSSCMRSNSRQQRSSRGAGALGVISATGCGVLLLLCLLAAAHVMEGRNSQPLSSEPEA
jgi:hypothetical protein